MINHEHKYRADCSYHDTRQVHAGDSDETEFGENRVPDDGPNDAQDDVPRQPFPATIHDFAAVKPAMSPTTTFASLALTKLAVSRPRSGRCPTPPGRPSTPQN
jgi:hypothetical protein